MSVNVTFNGNSLQTFDGNHGIIVQDIQHAGKNTKQAQAYAMSHANRSTIPYVEWPNKPITITGQIVGTSITDCDNQIDIFNSLLLGQNATLAFDYNGGSLNRLYTATATSVDVTRPGGLAWANFSVTFTATTPFGTDSYQTSIAANLVSNCDFETNTTGWTASGVATITSSTTVANTGTHSMRLASSGAGTSGANTATGTSGIPISALTPYTYSGYIQAGTTGRTCVIVASYYNGAGTFISSTTSPSVNDVVGSWTRISLTDTSPANAAFVSISFQFTVPGAENHYVDSVQVEQGSAANTFNACIGLTSSSVSFPFVALGTAPYQQPVITVTLTAIGGSPAAGTISIGNNATGQQINITRTWTAGDILVIDTTLTTTTPVTVNGNAVSFTGAFPSFFSSAAGTAGTLTYFDNFASRTFTISAVYSKAYL